MVLAVSHQLLTTEPQVQFCRPVHTKFVVGKVALGQVCLLYFSISLASIILPCSILIYLSITDTV